MLRITRVQGNLYQLQSNIINSANARQAHTSQWLYDKGLRAETTGEPEKALKYYRQALVKDPEATGALVNIGTIEYNAGNMALAEEHYREALRIDPFYALAYYNLGICFSDRTESVVAIEYYLKALSCRPDYADAHFNLAREYETIREKRNAVKHYALYLRYNGGDYSYWQDRARAAIKRLKKRDLRIIHKQVAPEQGKTTVTDSQAG